MKDIIQFNEQKKNNPTKIKIRNVYVSSSGAHTIQALRILSRLFAFARLAAQNQTQNYDLTEAKRLQSVFNIKSASVNYKLDVPFMLVSGGRRPSARSPRCV